MGCTHPGEEGPEPVSTPERAWLLTAAALEAISVPAFTDRRLGPRPGPSLCVRYSAASANSILISA